MVRGRFHPADSAQQVVGGFLLAGPFVVTEEVWRLAESMGTLHTGLATLIVFLIGYGALYHADRGRDLEDEEKEPTYLGVPLRFVSLLLVSYAAVTILVLIFRAPETFGVSTLTTVKAVSVGTIFSVIGAATADSLF